LEIGHLVTDELASGHDVMLVDHPVVDDRCVMLKLKLMSWLQTCHLNSY